MGQRVDLHAILTTILGTDYVYFQPPPSLYMKYPCIVYNRDFEDTKFADDKPYARKKRYQITVIHEDPDNDLREKIADLPMCTFDRFFTADKLNHDVFQLFF